MAVREPYEDDAPTSAQPSLQFQWPYVASRASLPKASTTLSRARARTRSCADVMHTPSARYVHAPLLQRAPVDRNVRVVARLPHMGMECRTFPKWDLEACATDPTCD